MPWNRVGCVGTVGTFRIGFRYELSWQGNDFELIPMVKMKIRHPIEGSFGTVVNFSWSVIIAELWWPEVARLGKRWPLFAFFWKNDPYQKIFKILFRKDSPPHRLTSVCKFREIWATWNRQVVRYLPDKKQNFASLFSSRYCMDRAQNVPGPAPDNVLRMLQISSKLVHFQRSSIWMHQHHPNALKSECNSQLKPSFEPNNYEEWSTSDTEEI